ncbi:hypothetical protein CKO44_16180 [Rubrivivax gelatinosus]|uniref:Uncharacterized protein n=1 Tax=Rubrivivax gelatinosus TaxID=28068 RepID=A0ABS1DRR4_RUBGE|nr:hypothetical protein [Rubrivivax gelatinosus]MBK1712084.1 hypothetical protein [Rubrivivax gelatinosus]
MREQISQLTTDLGTTLKAGHEVLLDAAAHTLEGGQRHRQPQPVQRQRGDGERWHERGHGRGVQGQRRRAQHDAQHDQRGADGAERGRRSQPSGAGRPGPRCDERRHDRQAGARLGRAEAAAAKPAERADRGGLRGAGVQGLGHLRRRPGRGAEDLVRDGGFAAPIGVSYRRPAAQ